MKKKAPPPSTQPQRSKSETLRIKEMAGRTEDQIVADLVAEGVATATFTALRFSKPDHGEISLTDLVDEVRKCGQAVNAGDMAGLERMLVGQTIALNAIFGELARRAALNLGEFLPAAETYMRLALKAQGQARATLETLAAIKSPPVVIARQANFAGGHQQVVNGSIGAAVRAPAGESPAAPNELLEAFHEQRLDTGAKGAAGGADPQLAPVGAVHRAADT